MRRGFRLGSVRSSRSEGPGSPRAHRAAARAVLGADQGRPGTSPAARPARCGEAACRDHDRPQRAGLPADLARATTRASSTRRTSTCSTTTRATARPTERASSGSPSITTRWTTPGWSRRSAELQHELLDRYDAVLVTDVDEIVSPGAGMGHARRLHRRVRGMVRQLHRLRDPPHGRPRAALRPESADPRPARLLVREQRLQQAGACHRADGLAAGLPPPRRRPGQPRPQPVPHPPAQNGLRDLPRATSRPPRAGLERDRPRGGLGRVQPDRRRRASSSSWFYGDSGFEEDGVHIKVERIPESWRGLF